jgi:hypothetical protein
VRRRGSTADLKSGASFVIEVAAPRLAAPAGETVRPFHNGPGGVDFDEFDVGNQRLVPRHYRRSSRARHTLRAVPLRVAGRTRPHGAARRHETRPALRRLAR